MSEQNQPLAPGGLIHRLPPEVFNKIAAGEVVQRPASVLKELLDNAVDSGAGTIQIRVESAGRTLIRVRDNGCGISESDIRLAFEPHATSKVQTIDDLFNIRTLGFRGEALASIASVSQVTMATKRIEDHAGYEIEIWGGSERRFEPASGLNGTVVSVRNLFYNVPARRAFLKSDQTELRNCIQVFYGAALANPEIAFVLETESETIFDLPSQTLEERITGLFGKEFRASILPIDEQTSSIRISGFAGDPKLVRKTRGEQFLFVNGRPFLHRFFSRVIMEEYAPWLGEEVYPFYALFFELSPESVDVNVHPAKLEVKFDDERGLAGILRSVIRKILYERFGSPLQPDPGTFELPVFNRQPAGFTIHPRAQFSFGNSRLPAIQPDATEMLYGDKPESTGQPNLFTGRLQSSRTFWQLHQSYIVTQTLTGLCLIDQHAAHKRILFERALETAISGFPMSQQLLFPQQLSFSASDFLLLKELHPEIERLGFSVQLLSGNAAILSGVPAGVEVGDEKTVIQSMLLSYQELSRKVSFDIREKLAAAMAGRLAISKGKTLSEFEMERMADQLFACKMPFVDPLGKPTISYLSLDEIAGRFAAPS